MKTLLDHIKTVNEAEDEGYGVLHAWTNDNSETLFNVMVDKTFNTKPEAVEHMSKLVKRFCKTYERYGKGVEGYVGFQRTSWDAVITHFFKVYSVSHIKNKYKWYNMDKDTVNIPR
jgi:hypothetical protein